MAYGDYDEYDDIYEQAEQAVREDSETKVESVISPDGDLNFTVGISGLAKEIMWSVRAELKKDLMESIKKQMITEVQPVIKELIQSGAKDFVANLMTEITEKDEITIGGGWDSTAKTITYKDFVKQEVKQRVESGEIRMRDNRGNDRTVKFKDYIIDNCVNAEIVKYMSNEVDSIRKDINSRVKDIFDTQTKNMLSETVMSVIMSSDTYRKIDGNIKCIADKAGTGGTQ